MTSPGVSQPRPLCVILFCGLTPKASELSPDACWKGLWDKGWSPNCSHMIHHQTTSTSSRISHHRQSQERENVLLLWTPSAGARQSQGSPVSGNTAHRELSTAQQTELLLAVAARWLWRLVPTGDALAELCVRREAPCPCATQRGSVGSPQELLWGSSQTLHSTRPRRPSPASCTASEQRSELGKTGR